MTASVISPDGTITQTIRSPAGSASTSASSDGTSVTSGLRSYPVTSIPAARMRSRMFAPILPRPTRPMCIAYASFVSLVGALSTHPPHSAAALPGSRCQLAKRMGTSR